VQIPTDLIAPLDWPLRDGDITREMFFDDLRELRRNVIIDNEKKRQLIDTLNSINNQQGKEHDRGKR